MLRKIARERISDETRANCRVVTVVSRALLSRRPSRRIHPDDDSNRIRHVERVQFGHGGVGIVSAWRHVREDTENQISAVLGGRNFVLSDSARFSFLP